MKLLHGQQLVTELRKLSDSVSERLWIAVPYIGSPTTIRRVLGKQWFDNPSVSVKLLTDTSDLTGIDTETIQLFHSKGPVKTLFGLHAKIYIVDDACLISSANLTNTAFAKRYEIGMLCNSSQAKQVIDTFVIWWNKSENVNPDKLNKIFSTKTKKSKEEQTGISLPTLHNLPNDPGSFIKNLGFLNYERLLLDYEDFAKEYKSVQRIWRKQPLYFEVDGFLDFLFHWDIQPSKPYEKKKPRNLTVVERKNEIKKWAKKFSDWAAQDERDNEWRLKASKFIKGHLSPRRIYSLTKNEIREVLLHTNAGKNREGNCNKIVNDNKLSEVKDALNILVNADNLPLPERFSRCNNLHGIGSSIMSELLGYCYPDKYPLLNTNSKSGLRFFGYQIKAY